MKKITVSLNLQKLRQPRVIFTLSIAMVLAFFLFDLVAQYFYFQRTAAVAHQTTISRQTLEKTLLEEFGPGLLDEMIKEALITYELDQAGVSVTKEEVETEILNSIKLYGDEENFWRELTSHGISEDELTERVRLSLAIEAYLLPTIPDPSATEIDSYYQENQTLPQFQEPGLSQEDINDNIKNILIISRLEQRKLEWPNELLQKYKVENYLITQPSYQPFGYLLRLLDAD